MSTLLLAGLSACGGSQAPSRDVFIALDRDFQGYEAWQRFELDGDSQGAVHPVGPRKIYINELPDAGAAEFPVGTMIVKEIFDSHPPAHTVIHAMVKRGGNYNVADGGARNWEWFELSRDGGADPVVEWRGIAPPAGRGYPSAFGGSCNTCHGESVANDYVMSE